MPSVAFPHIMRTCIVIGEVPLEEPMKTEPEIKEDKPKARAYKNTKMALDKFGTQQIAQDAMPS